MTGKERETKNDFYIELLRRYGPKNNKELAEEALGHQLFKSMAAAEKDVDRWVKKVMNKEVERRGGKLAVLSDSRAVEERMKQGFRDALSEGPYAVISKRFLDWMLFLSGGAIGALVVYSVASSLGWII